MAPSVHTESGKHGGGSDTNALGTPLPPLRVEFTEEDIRETAYEILVAVSGNNVMSLRSMSMKFENKVQIQKSLTSTAASQMKKAFGLQSSGSSEIQRSSSFKSKKAPTMAETLRVQMHISEHSDMRTRRALSRATASQASKRSGSILVPLELLQHIGPTVFKDQNEYLIWLRRQLKVLEAGLLAHPLVPGDGGMDALRLKQTLYEMMDGTADTGKNSEVMQALRSAAMGRATRALNGEYGDFLHWADGYPLNVHLYEALLSACFDTVDEGKLIGDLEEVLEVIKKTWIVLGIDQTVHDLLFTWVLFRQFVATGQNEVTLIKLAETQLGEVAKDVKGNLKAEQMQLLNSTLSAMQSWAERRLLAYHDSFPEGANEVMESLLAVAVISAKIQQEDISREHRRRGREETNVPLSRVDVYVRSSLRTAFAQLMETVDNRRRSFKGECGPPPALAILAQDTMSLVSEEVQRFSPALKQWHPFAGGVAAATLHGCYRREYKQYLSGITSMTLDTVAILKAAEDLEKQLVQIAVEEGAECEDGGKGLIREMPLFEADQAMSDLTKKWVYDNLERMTEYVNRSIKQENWSPVANKDHFAPSAVEVLRILEESLEAFFAMPTAQFPELLKDLVMGLDKALQHYVTQTVVPCGTRELHTPTMPPLTRCKTNKSWLGSHKSKGKVEVQRNHQRKVTGTEGDAFSLPYLCVRINTLDHINTQLEFLEKKVRYGWQKEEPTPSVGGKRFSKNKSNPPPPPPIILSADSSFQRTRVAIQEGINQLTELAAYRVVFSDLRDVFGDGLYAGDVGSARISGVIDQLDAKLGEIAETSVEKLRNQIVTALMKACFDGFLLVLLAGGTSRSFTVGDSDKLKDDLTALKDLFLADGDGLPRNVVEQAASPASQILTLFELSSNELIQIYSASMGEGSRTSSRSSSIPPTTGKWSATDANTLLRVLCYRSDDTASKFLKKTYHLPKKAHA